MQWVACPEESRWNLGFLRRNCRHFRFFCWFLLAESLNSPCKGEKLSNISVCQVAKTCLFQGNQNKHLGIIGVFIARKLHITLKCSILKLCGRSGIQEILWDGKPVPSLKGVSWPWFKASISTAWKRAETWCNPTWNGDKVSYHWDAQLNYDDSLLGRDFLHAGLAKTSRSIFAHFTAVRNFLDWWGLKTP